MTLVSRWDADVSHKICCIVTQDYCGVLSEEAVRKNCVLVYELLDEVGGIGPSAAEEHHVCPWLLVATISQCH